MNRQQRRLVVVVVAFVAVVLVIQNQRATAPTPEPSATVSVAAPVEVQNALFAKRRIEKNTKFDPSRITDLVELRKDLPKTELPREKLATSFDELRGRIALEDIQKGEPIILTRIPYPAEIGGVSFHIKEGHRAVTLRIDKVRSVGGFIQQGDKVDIIGSFHNTGGSALTKYVLQGVTLLAVNQVFLASTPQGEAAASPSPAPSPAATPSPGDPNRDRITGGDVQLVTFELRPEDAERLIVASENASLYMVLRNPSDPDVSHIPAVDSVDVYVERPKKSPAPKYDIDMLKGMARTVVGVRLQSVAGRDITTGVRRATYYENLEPTIRDVKAEDLRSGSREIR